MLRPRFADSSFPTFSSRLSTRFSKPRAEDLWDDTANGDVTADTSIEDQSKISDPRRINASSSRFATKPARLGFNHFPAHAADESTESLLNVIQSLTQAKRRLEAELKTSREFLQEKETNLNQANASLNSMAESMESSSSENDRVKNELNKLKGENSCLCEKVSLLEEEKKSGAKALVERAAELKKNSQKLREYEETINGLKIECSKRDSMLNKMEQNTSALASQLFQEQSKGKCLERDISLTRSQMEQTRQRDHVLQTSLQDFMNGKLNGTKIEIDATINTHLGRLPSMLSSLEEKIQQQSDALKERDQEYKKMREEIKRCEKVVCNQVKSECKIFSEESRGLLDSFSVTSQEFCNTLQGAQASTTEDAHKIAKSLVTIAKTKDLTVLGNKMKSLENEVIKSLKRENSLQETIRLTEENCTAARKERDDLRREHQKCSLEIGKLKFTIKAFQQDKTPSKEWGAQLIAQLNDREQEHNEEKEENEVEENEGEENEVEKNEENAQKVQVPASQPVKRLRGARSQQIAKKQKISAKETINSDTVKPDTQNRKIDEFDIFSDDSCDSQPFTATFSRRRQ